MYRTLTSIKNWEIKSFWLFFRFDCDGQGKIAAEDFRSIIDMEGINHEAACFDQINHIDMSVDHLDDF